MLQSTNITNHQPHINLQTFISPNIDIYLYTEQRDILYRYSNPEIFTQMNENSILQSKIGCPVNNTYLQYIYNEDKIVLQSETTVHTRFKCLSCAQGKRLFTRVKYFFSAYMSEIFMSNSRMSNEEKWQCCLNIQWWETNLQGAIVSNWK